MPRGHRPPCETPLHFLLAALEDLRVRLSHTGDKPSSMSQVEFYDSSIRASQYGRKCQYALKSQNLFAQLDYPDIKVRIQEIVKLIDEVESARSKT